MGFVIPAKGSMQAVPQATAASQNMIIFSQKNVIVLNLQNALSYLQRLTGRIDVSLRCRDMNLQNTFSSERLEILKPRHIFNVAGLKSLTP